MDHPPCCPDGRIVKNPCAAEVYRRRVYESYQLGGQWRGWRVQGKHLIGPGGIRWTPDTARRAWSLWTRTEP